ncbi:telomere zinc finger-associated protein-like [Anopheles albimanus]|uniref:C2H2-type domain-containing protein n=1 Tax=Anopheles albimanus TaxID=7167 RepID=A0A182FCJ3_ANOAL|nr:telomere zinc finger-associated protein-like [Anopheles albimanus]XP_035794271.1 telomere zinc finger-associated protein-like [Anopheles albimanus]
MTTKAYLQSALLSCCRTCLQGAPADQMIPLDGPRTEFDGTIGEFLDSLAIAIPPDLLPFIPASVCTRCHEKLEQLFKHHRKIMFVSKFLIGLAKGVLGDKSLLLELLRTDGDKIEQLCAEHGLEYGQGISVDDLLGRFCPFTADEQHTTESMDSDGNAQSERSSELEDDSSTRGSPKAQLQIEIVTDLERIVEENSDTERMDNVYCKSNYYNSDGNCDGFEGCSEENSKPTRKRTRQETPHSSKPVQRFACAKCSYKTSYPVAFDLHCQKHTNNESRVKKGYECPHPYCLRMFDTQQQLDQHQVASDHNRFVCEICGIELKYRFSLDIHLERHSGEAKFPCSYCSATFYTRTECQSHINSRHVVVDRTECPTCGAVFRNRKLLRQHQTSHESERKHQCNQCDVSFKSSHYLSRHIRETHEGVRFSCSYCNNSYRRKDKLRLHIEKVHQIQTYFVCDICVRSFETEEALQEHREHHANPKSLECGICLIAFLTEPEYKQHTCITYQDSYECCGRDLQHHNLYNRHVEMVHGVKVNARVRPKPNLLIGQQRAIRYKQIRGPTSCTMCGKVMSTATEKKNHICYIDEEMCLNPEVIMDESQQFEKETDLIEALSNSQEVES